MPTILIIEDSAILRAFYRVTLEDEGYRVVVARDGRAGVEAYRKEPADLVVCDLLLPEVDGLAAIRELREIDPAARVVAVSGGDDYVREDYLLEMARLLGVTQALAKPFGPDRLVDAVRLALAG